MHDVIKIEVSSQHEGELLITYLIEQEEYVTPFVVVESNKFFVKAAVSEIELNRALMIIRTI